MQAIKPVTLMTLTRPEEELFIRTTVEPDMAAITDIYGHHVVHGTASFELEPPGTHEMTRRWKAVTEDGYPHLVAVSDGLIVGYAYASAYRSRPAYRGTVEDSIYVRVGAEGRGIGHALLKSLVEECTNRGFHQMVAMIGDSTPASIAVHTKAGFGLVGILRSVGYKFGAWRDVTLMQLPLQCIESARDAR